MRIAHRLLLALSILASAPVWADVGRDEAAAIARQQADGRVLSVERVDAGRRAVWRVKVLTSRGEVRVIFVDAATGRPG
jgi:uncharacterized membrane protein YkoI